VTLNELRLLLDYHYWARDRIVASVGQLTPEQYTRDLGSSFKSVRDTLVHVYSADWIWRARWEGQSPRTPIDPLAFPDVASLVEAWAQLEARYYSLLDAMDPADIERVMSYTLLSGQQYSGVFWQMLQHVVNHGSYHRGQLTTMLRQLGAEPPKSMDLIAFYRERQTRAT
jgi:uncharacterized damage-inducible protein DinB